MNPVFGPSAAGGASGRSARTLSPFWLLFILTGLNLFNYLDRSVLYAVRTPLAGDFGINYGDSGRTITAFMIGYFLTAPFFGYLGDRFSRKWLIAFGIFVWSLGTVLTGFAATFGALLAYRVMVGVGEASYATISPSLISDAFASTRRNNALTIFYVAIPVGSALGYLLGGEISANWGWRHAFIWAGVPGLLLALVLLPFKEPRRGQAELAEGQTAAKPKFSDYRKLFTNVNYQLVVWGYVAYTFALGAFAFWGPTYLEEARHLSTAASNRFFGAVVIGAGLGGTLLGGLLASAWHRRNPAGYAWLLCLSVLLAIPCSFGAFLTSDTKTSMVLLGSSMFLLFLSTGPVNTLIIETVPLNLRASAMALSIFLIHLFGDMWSPEILGRLGDAWHDLNKAALILPMALVLAFLLWFILALKTAWAARLNPKEETTDPRLAPGSLSRWGLRAFLWALTHTVYRVRIVGNQNIPATGGALLVCNHLSFVDGLLLVASVRRHIRFVMYKGIYEMPWVKPFARVLNAIPISSELRPREMLRSLQTASDAVRNGELVCIFAEGQITRIGQMLPFRRGFERVMKDVDAPIIPVALDGLWGSIFSFEKRRFMWKVPQHIPYPVTVNFGKPLPHTSTPAEVRTRVQELMAEAWTYRKPRMRTLHREFIRTARKHPRRIAMADAQGPGVSFGNALIRTVLLARRLRLLWQDQRMVGLLLPPCVPAAVTNLAALMLGKVPVNLNYTVSESILASCIRQCEIRTVITSRAFMARIKLNIPCETLYLEDIAGKPASAEPSLETHEAGEKARAKFGPPTLTEKILAAAIARFIPAGLVDKTVGRKGSGSVDDLATVIFSSGSTGDPKGVMLSHYNVGSNIQQMNQVFGLMATDGFLGILPFFHSFGFTGTLCLPAVLGARAVYYPNPLDGKSIGPLVSEHALTFLLATPTFLQIYLRSCTADDFGSLRVVMTAAEKLPERVASAFEERFGIRPLEGYGCTECSPAVSVNTHDFRSAGVRQVGAKRGKIGHPLPGMCVRVVDPETFAPRAMAEPGLLLVRGPNVMQGYLGRPEKTAEVLRDGWYVTGDIAALDEDGFLQITDRLSRFSKIGGEMVPHIKVEEKLHELAGSTEQSFAVTGIPDEKKGERLVVLYKLSEEQLRPCLEKLAQCDLPNLWKPRAENFFHVDALPYLGTGKLNLQAIREIAVQKTREQPAVSNAG
jgi:acyl-[acyl-carrier-protein]-phospholipid O-acyltransferase/long-chain-fatty-acid--[acyl-carrier-protein] ligase